MMKLFSFQNIIIIALVSFVLYKQCSVEDKEITKIKVDGKNYELLKHKVDTVTVVKKEAKYIKGDDIYHETIVEEYHTKVLYKDRLVLNDGLGIVEITDTISRNKIIGRKWNAQINERTITDTKIVKELPKNQVYIGAQGVMGNSIVMVGPQVTFKTKKDNLYGVNFFLDANGNKYYGASIGWKIRLKK